VYEQMGSGETPSLGLLSPQVHPHGLLDPALQVSPPGELLERTDLSWPKIVFVVSLMLVSDYTIITVSDMQF